MEAQSDFGKLSLELHKVNHGKWTTASKVPLKSREDLSLAYTPGVAAVSSRLTEHPEEIGELTSVGNIVAVISDGSAVLGLGNIGPEGAYPVMEGKALLFKQFGDVDAIPLVLNTQNTDEIVEWICMAAPSFGGINLEDIAAPRCFEIEARLKERLSIPVFHDDQHGTAIVVLAGLINALKATGRVVNGAISTDVKIVVNGAGAAGIAITELLLAYGFKNIVILDTKGAIYSGRPDMNPSKEQIAEKINPEKLQGGLTQVMTGADVFIGVSKAGLVTQDMVRSMASKAIVFAMANPNPEISEDDAKAAGAAVTATGRSDCPNQLNNVLVFPGLFRGALDHQIRQFTPVIFLKAAETLAALIPNPSTEKFISSPFDPGVAEAAAKAVL